MPQGHQPYHCYGESAYQLHYGKSSPDLAVGLNNLLNPVSCAAKHSQAMSMVLSCLRGLFSRPRVLELYCNVLYHIMLCCTTCAELYHIALHDAALYMLC